MRTLLEIAVPVVVVLVAVCLLALVQTVFPPEKYNPDHPDNFSGMYLRTDKLTGCQYLSGPRGGITPRMNGAGRHVGCKEGA